MHEKKDENSKTANEVDLNGSEGQSDNTPLSVSRHRDINQSNLHDDSDSLDMKCMTSDP